jgi:hypothetical protein
MRYVTHLQADQQDKQSEEEKLITIQVHISAHPRRNYAGRAAGATVC